MAFCSVSSSAQLCLEWPAQLAHTRLWDEQARRELKESLPSSDSIRRRRSEAPLPGHGTWPREALPRLRGMSCMQCHVSGVQLTAGLAPLDLAPLEGNLPIPVLLVQHSVQPSGARYSPLRVCCSLVRSLSLTHHPVPCVVLKGSSTWSGRIWRRMEPVGSIVSGAGILSGAGSRWGAGSGAG